MKYKEKTLPIKSWAEEDRPREKMVLKGKANLSEAELLAILLGSGNNEETAVGLAQRILQHYDNNLNELGKVGISELTKFRGIGAVKAIGIIAALELGRRRQLSVIKDRSQIKSSSDVHQIFAPILQDLPHEEFWILLLNRSNKVLSRERISMGGVSGTVVDAKIIFKKALDQLASSIILCHNHPSGNLKPSQADLDITKKLKKAGEVLEISVLDHVIVSENGFYSFADEGMLGG